MSNDAGSTEFPSKECPRLREFLVPPPLHDSLNLPGEDAESEVHPGNLITDSATQYSISRGVDFREINFLF